MPRKIRNSISIQNSNEVAVYSQEANVELRLKYLSYEPEPNCSLESYLKARDDSLNWNIFCMIFELPLHLRIKPQVIS